MLKLLVQIGLWQVHQWKGLTLEFAGTKLCPKPRNLDSSSLAFRSPTPPEAPVTSLGANENLPRGSLKPDHPVMIPISWWQNLLQNPILSPGANGNLHSSQPAEEEAHQGQYRGQSKPCLKI